MNLETASENMSIDNLNNLSDITQGIVHQYQQGNLACTLTSKGHFNLEM